MMINPSNGVYCSFFFAKTLVKQLFNLYRCNSLKTNLLINIHYVLLYGANHRISLRRSPTRDGSTSKRAL